MLLAAITILSASILAYEILLTRLFSIIQWHHFAYMVISIALLGYGASGSFLTLTRDVWRPRLVGAFVGFAILFALTSLACFALGQRLPFNALELIWDPKQLAYLLALYLLLTIPFFCGATCIGLAFACYDAPVGRVYFRDLLGAGIGAIFVVVLLYLVWPVDALRAIAALGLIAAAVALLETIRPPQLALASLLGGLALVVCFLLPSTWIELRSTPYKALSQTLTMPGTEIEVERSSPVGLASAVRSKTIPFRHVPGLSLNNRQPPADQIGVFVDGDGPTPITAFDGEPAVLRYLDFTVTALPFHLLERPAVLVLGAGGGSDVLLALLHDAKRIDAVELDPIIVGLVRQDYGDHAGRIYDHPTVRVHVAEARGFVAANPDRYDLILLPLLDSFSAATAGTLSLSEGFIYTTEAFELYLRHLQPDGLLAITRWLKLPPRDSLKLMSTALSALKRRGHEHPERHIALIRSWDTTTLLVKNSPLVETEVDAIRVFAAERAFDVAYLPGLDAREANRAHILPAPYFYDGAKALAGPERASFLQHYKFDLTPATDDRPYFFDFFKWRSLPELFKLKAVTGGALLDWGYLILAVTLVQAIALSLVLILLPLLLGMKQRESTPDRWWVAFYFAAIGLAFLFVEIASIQRFMLFLNHPIYAIAVVLAGFLIFAGLGSFTSSALDRWLRGRTSGRIGGLDLAILSIIVLAIAYVFGLPSVIPLLVALPNLAKVAASLLLIAPLAFFMGMPFPLALGHLKANLPELVPWAWGINGCASVISAVLATLLAMTLGFSGVVLLAAGLYAAAATIFRRTSAIGMPAPGRPLIRS